jgi:hypothetical protein
MLYTGNVHRLVKYPVSLVFATEEGFKPPPPEIPKALQNRAKLNPVVKSVKNCWI